MSCATRRLHRIVKAFHRQFSSRSCLQARLKVGDQLPSAIVYEDTPSNAIDVAELFKGKKGILFAVPGAYTPGCSQAHIPEYLVNHDKFVAEGYEIVACLAVNDPFVMSAWGKEVDPEGKIRMLADMKRNFTKAIDMELDCTKLLGNIRSLRYFMLVEDGVVTNFKMEPDDTGLACLLCIRKMRRRTPSVTATGPA